MKAGVWEAGNETGGETGNENGNENGNETGGETGNEANIYLLLNKFYDQVNIIIIQPWTTALVHSQVPQQLWYILTSNQAQCLGMKMKHTTKSIRQGSMLALGKDVNHISSDS